MFLIKYEMKFTLLLLLFVVFLQRSAPKRYRRRVAIPSNSSDIQDVNCHNCRRTINDFEGFISPMNNASDYFHELIYGWTIEVPLHHDILLTFSWANEEFSSNETSPCESCKPYFEIIYGYSSSEDTFKVDTFYNIRQLTKLSVPSHKTKVRFFSGMQCSESQKSANVEFTISFKAIPLEQTFSLYTLLSVLIPASFILLGVAYFCVIMKKKEENNHEAISLPIPIYVDLATPGCEFKKCKVKGKKNIERGLRLRTHHSSRLEEPKEITVISSLVDSEVSESSARAEDLITPDSTNPVPVAQIPTKKHFFKKRLPPKVNLLNRYPRSVSSTPRYASFRGEAENDDRLSKSDIVIYEKKKVCREMAPKVFNFDVLPGKEDVVAQTELETSVFLPSSGSSGDGLPNESARELPFMSPKQIKDV